LAERLIISFVVCGSMLVEASRASANERAQRARGGREPADDVYTMMRIACPAVCLTANALKWWGIVSLGPFWTFRVVVVPGARLVTAGPYRWLRHPNYAGVMGNWWASRS
jgi:isoprenylcysteine carboxyl methyltransferase (ICMT) family protein YpbQ